MIPPRTRKTLCKTMQKTTARNTKEKSTPANPGGILPAESRTGVYTPSKLSRKAINSFIITPQKRRLISLGHNGIDQHITQNIPKEKPKGSCKLKAEDKICRINSCIVSPQNGSRVFITLKSIRPNRKIINHEATVRKSCGSQLKRTDHCQSPKR